MIKPTSPHLNSPSSFKLSFETALAHLMIAFGSVARDPEDKWRDDQRGYSLGSYYTSSVNASLSKTEQFLKRLQAGARPVYDLCGPSDFGQEYRFNGTFTDSQLTVRYAVFPVILDDDLSNPVTLVCGVNFDGDSFVSMLKVLTSSNDFTIDEAIKSMEDRFADKKFSYYAIEYPQLEKK